MSKQEKPAAGELDRPDSIVEPGAGELVGLQDSQKFQKHFGLPGIVALGVCIGGTVSREMDLPRSATPY